MKSLLKSATLAMRKSLVHPKYKVLRRLTIREALLACEFLIARMLEITNTCYLCNKSSENIDYIFKFCLLAQGVWNRIKYNCPTHIFYEGNFLSLLELVYKNYKTHCKTFKQPMQKIAIIL